MHPDSKQLRSFIDSLFAAGDLKRFLDFHFLNVWFGQILKMCIQVGN